MIKIPRFWAWAKQRRLLRAIYEYFLAIKYTIESHNDPTGSLEALRPAWGFMEYWRGNGYACHNRNPAVLRYNYYTKINGAWILRTE